MDKESLETTKEKIERLVREVGKSGVPDDASSRFPFYVVCKLIELAINEEREACAVVAEGEGHYMCEDAQDTAKGIADLIRARSEL